MEKFDLDHYYLFTGEYYFDQFPFKINKITEIHQKIHVHDYIQAWYVKNGECSHWIGDIEISLKKGDLIILPPFVEHYLDSNDCQNLVLIGCDLSEEFIYSNTSMTNEFVKHTIVEDYQQTPFFRLNGSAQKEAETMFEQMLLEFSHKKPGFELLIKANVLQVFTIVLREKEMPKTKKKNSLLELHRSSIMKAVDYIDINYRKKITLAEVCKVTMMSPTYFAQIFKEITGRTFTEYINYLRVQNAIELFTDRTLTLKEIAEDVGLKDPAYFSRVFKKQIGISPEKYRNSMS